MKKSRNQNPKYSSIVALGLSSLLPSLAFANDSDEALTQLLSSTPSNPSDSKIQTIANYSPVVDLRTSRATQYDEVWDRAKRENIVWNQDANILITSAGSSISGNSSYVANNNATITLNAQLQKWGNWTSSVSRRQLNALFVENHGIPRFSGDGTFVLNVGSNLAPNTDIFLDGAVFSYFDIAGTGLYITSKFIFNATGTIGSFLNIGTSVGDDFGGTYVFRSPNIEINMDTAENQSTHKYIVYSRACPDAYNYGYPKFYFNANDNGEVDNRASVQKYTGNFFFDAGGVFMHLTNSQSFLNGNIQLGNQESIITFSNSASMNGSIDFYNKHTGNHSIVFDNADFKGVIKDTSKNDSNTPMNRSANTTITFKNTVSKTFGSTTEGVVDSSFKGSVIGNFDLSATSSTTINGGTSGDKGFLGTGTNKLTFVFKNDTKENASQTFTIGGGNSKSYYALSGFQKGNTALDLSGLDNNSNSLYKKLEKAGIKIAVDTSSADTNNHLQGTLLFTNTNIQVGSNGNALFGTQENIVGSGNALNGLALGAMFGNATWVDKNNDGSITANEITANAGNINYKLTSTNPSSPSADNGIDTNTSTGNIGANNDGVKKQVGFIFTNGTYSFGGDKQGYSGVINGGTDDSKYYFANAGYIGRSQIQNAKGDLVLFNTAFRGDLGVENADVGIMLDFSNGRNGLRAEIGTDNANIVGSGSKNITFNFTGNTNATKYAGAVVGSATSSAKYTMLNLQGTSANKSLSVEAMRATGTLIDAFKNAGLSNFDNPTGNGVENKGYGQNSEPTNIANLSTSNTTLALRGTSLNTAKMTFGDYKYDFVFGNDIGETEGVTIADSKLYGNIDLSSNTNTGHSIILRGDSLGSDSTSIIFSGTATNFGASGGGVFVYDDSTATSTPKTLTLSGLTQANYLSTNSSLNISNTNLVGDLWLDNSSAVNLDFRGGRTWSMDNSGIYLKGGSNLVVYGKISAITPNQAPNLKIKTAVNQQNIQLINTGANVTWQNQAGYNNTLSQTFVLRGTSLTTVGNSNDNKRLSGMVGTGSFNMVFAKGTNVDTTVAKSGGGVYKITDEALDKDRTYGGTYTSNGYVGNYIAESSGAITGINSNSGFNITFVGSQAWNATPDNISTQNYFGQASTLALVNASNGWTTNNSVSGISAGYVGKFFQRDFGTKANIVIEGTSLDWGNQTDTSGGIVRRSSNQGALNFTITFINEGSSDDANTDKTYVGDKYTDLATTRANGALKDSILKVQESKLVNGLNFKGANANVLFVGDEAQSLDGTTNGSQKKILEGGTTTSTFTFRDSNLNAGGSGTSSIQNIKGTIAFDLSHTNEDMSISGALGNMFGDGSGAYNGTGKYQTQFANNTTFNTLVFTDNSAQSSATLDKLKTNGVYFNDSDTFGSALSNQSYSAYGQLKNALANSSNLSFGAGSIAINGLNTEIVFIGANSHGFDNDSGSATTLGNSADSTLTFIDAGNLKIENIQNGQGTLNLIGTTNFDLGNGAKTLSLYKAATTRTTPEITGAGITINAIFTGNNPLGGAGQNIAGGTNTITGASTANIGQANEETIYHILFDYSSSNLTFGTHHAYTGTIAGLTSDSIIKFKNAGYIDGTQIANTDAIILLDNTQLKDNFLGDSAILDFTKGRSSISGSILTSDTRESGAVLSRKVITFDLTNTTSTKLNYGSNIQAGYKYTDSTLPSPTPYNANGQSVLTFQNASAMTLGNDTGTNPSDFIKSLANDVGFSGIGGAEISDTNFAKTPNASYILKGTKLAFQGTNITATGNKAINESTYELDLSFNTSSNRGNTGLDNTLNSSTLTANSITMGEITTTGGNKPLGLSLSFVGKGSLIGGNENSLSNTLNVKLKENARFNFEASSSNGLVGTLILSQNNGATPTKLTNVSKDSSLSISVGTMNFIGNFSQNNTPSATDASAGAINASFNGTNKIYGTLAGQGEMNVTISGEGVFSSTSMSNYSFAKPSGFGDANALLDASNATSGTITLSHTSGNVGVAGKAIIATPPSGQTQTYTSLDFSNARGDITLKGAFDLGSTTINLNSTNTLYLAGDTDFSLANNASLTITEGHLQALSDAKGKTLKINVLKGNNSGNGANWVTNLNLTNLDPDLTISLYTTATTKIYGYQGNWNIRGTNINIENTFWANNQTSGAINMVFAKGAGRETAPSTENQTTPLTLDKLTSSDKINASSLGGSFTPYNLPTDNAWHGSALLLRGKLTLIGKEALGIATGNEIIDGGWSGQSPDFSIGMYNSIVKSGNILFDANIVKDSSYTIQDRVTIRGTDTFNLSAQRATSSALSSQASNIVQNNSTIDAVFVNSTTSATATDTSITGVRYINANYGNDTLKATLAQNDTSDASGALSQTKLKTLESKAYGNITLASGVTANMKFIGENSHSFDGKTAVYKGADNAYGTSDDEFYYSSNASSTTDTDWKKIMVNDAGAVSLSSTNMSATNTADNTALATLSGGNANSRFDFDHTSVSLDLVKNANGKTYVYNSNVVGDIAVSGLVQTPADPDAPTLKPNEITPSTTLFFNAKMEEKPLNGNISPDAQELTKTAKSFIDSQFKDALGINLDLSTAHTLSNDNLTNSSGTYKLGATTKQTNIVLIGKGAVSANGANGDSLSLSFLPDTADSTNYAYTLISGGAINSDDLKRAGDKYEQNATIFGNSKVQLVDTYIKGAIDLAQVGFINTNADGNQSSSWGGTSSVEQYLIFDMGGSTINKLNKDASTDVITNTSASSHYIFSNLTKKEVTFATSMKNTLNNAMSGVAPTSKQVIGNDVKGYLGLRGISVKGDIDESSNGVDIVFNSTSDSDASQGIAYKEWFEADNTHHSEIIEGEKNLVSHGTDYEADPNISGYAVLKASTSGGVVTIKGTANKNITFIGANSVEGGFNNLKIESGGVDSNYTFYSVGTLEKTFLKNVGLYNETLNQQATAGSFTFTNSTIIGDINVDQNTNNRTDGSANVLTFDNVDYSGTISGTLNKNLVFGANSNDITIIGGSNTSSYDFSNLKEGSTISLSMDMSDTSNSGKYYTSTITGFDEGNISLVGSLRFATHRSETTDNNNQTYSNSFTFNDNASWVVTDNSRVMNLSLSNSGTNYNLDLASAPRVSSRAVADDSKNLRVLEVGTLSSNGGQVLLGTQIDTSNQANSKSDKIRASVIDEGTLYVTAQDASITSGSFETDGESAIVLVSSDNISNAEVKGSKRNQGLSYIETALEHQVSADGNNWSKAVADNELNGNNSHRWVLSSLDASTNQELVDESGFIISNPYRMLLIETNNLNKRMGDLRDNDYNQGAWIRVFNGSDSGEGSKNLYTNIQLGYDYGTPAIGAKNYSGVAFSTSIVDIDGNQYSGKANTYSLAVYNSYIADSGFYVDTIGKYLYTDQKLSPNGSADSSFGSHALSLGLEVGYRAYMGESNFYFETQAEAIGGVIFGVNNIDMGIIGDRNVVGDLKTTLALNTRVGIVQGYSLKTQSGFRADFRLGVSLVNESVNDNNSITLYDSITEASTSIANDTKAVLNVGTNLILTDQWRVYLDAERSFGGKRNVDYQANIGARFSFGDITKPLPKPEKPLPLKVEEKK